MLERLVHPENASFLISVTLSGIFMSLRLIHPENASYSILVTLSGIIISSRSTQSENALLPIHFTGKLSISAGISTDVADLSQPEIIIPDSL